jgi:phospholipid/cholesterol/gamma-HCH transport system substrate-binding protein
MEVVVGAFMVMVFLGLGYFTIILSRDKWFGPKFTMHVVFSNVMGLRDGDNVVVRGMPVGKVKGLKLSDDGTGVEVVANLVQDLEVREGYRMRVVSTSVLGGRHLAVDEGPRSGKPLPLKGTPFRGETPIDLMEEAAETISAIKKGLITGGVISNIQNIASQLSDVATRLNSGKGTLGRLLSEDDTLYHDLSSAVASLRNVAERIDKGEGTMGKLMSKDDTLYRDLSSAVASIKNVAERVDKGEGTMGKLLSKDDVLYQDLSSAVASLKNIATSVDKGEGTVGKLIKDDTLYEDVKKAVGEVRATIDDYRETAPVVTFTSIFFGAF